MITNQTLDAVSVVASNVLDAGRYLDVLPGSPLADLVARSCNMDVARNFDVARIVEATSVPASDGGASMHDIFMETAVDEVGRIVVAGHDLARNTIMPLTKMMIDNYEKTLAAIVYDVAVPVVVLPNIYHRIWGSPMVKDLVKRYENAPVDIKPFPFALPKLTVAQLTDIVKTGVSQVDELIEKWLDDQDPEAIEYAFDQVFITRSLGIGRKTNARHELEGAFNLNRNSILLAFLVAQGLERNMPDGLDQPLEAVRRACSHLMVQAGRAVCAEITKREVSRTSRTLITHVTQKSLGRAGVQKIIHVNNDVYVEFLEEPMGSVEALCGAVHAGGSMGYSDILAKKEAYEKVWSKVMGLHNQNLAATKFTFQRQALTAILTRYVNGQADETLPAPKPYLHELIGKVVGSLEPKDFTDAAICVRDVVCAVLYADSNAGMFFKAMDQAELENPNLNARECALYATIDLLARWLASQIKSHSLQAAR